MRHQRIDLAQNPQRVPNLPRWARTHPKQADLLGDPGASKLATRPRDLALLLVLALSGCENPEDGTLAIAFLLETPPASETRLVPPETETGVPPLAFAQAQGRCDCDVARRSVRCTFAGLPVISPTTRQPLSYQLRFLLWYGPLGARFDATALDRDPGGRDPDAPPPPMVPPLPRAPAGPIAPDPFGKAERTITASDIPLDRVAGGELQLLAVKDTGETAAYVVIDGRVGNLRESAEPAAPPTAAPMGGHVH